MIIHKPIPAIRPKPVRLMKTKSGILLSEISFYGWFLDDHPRHYDGEAGLVLANYNSWELWKFRMFAKQLGALPFRQEKGSRDIYFRNIIGDYRSMVSTIWFDSKDRREQFIKMIKTFPCRKYAFIVPNNRALQQIEPYIRGTNYHTIMGDKAIALGITDEVTEDNLVLMRLAI